MVLRRGFYSRHEKKIQYKIPQKFGKGVQEQEIMEQYSQIEEFWDATISLMLVGSSFIEDSSSGESGLVGMVFNFFFCLFSEVCCDDWEEVTLDGDTWGRLTEENSVSIGDAVSLAVVGIIVVEKSLHGKLSIVCLNGFTSVISLDSLLCVCGEEEALVDLRLSRISRARSS